ncbi:MAG: nucleotidyltransferase domain-containing protein [Thermoproteota archaeon]
MKIKDKIKEIIENVLRQNGYTLHSIFLFGSRARGDFEKESDYDLLVIIKESINMKQKREIWMKVYHQLHEDFPLTPFDLIVKTATDFDEEKDIVNTISNEACVEGIRI